MITNPMPEASAEIWAISEDDERYGHHNYPTKEEAIAEGRMQYSGSFYVGELERPTPPEDLFDAMDWLEHVSCQEDYSGEHAEFWDNSTKEQREELNDEIRKVMAAWLDRHDLRPSFWNVTKSEKIEPILVLE